MSYHLRNTIYFSGIVARAGLLYWNRASYVSTPLKPLRIRVYTPLEPWIVRVCSVRTVARMGLYF